ncbi:MAG: hypothetical protein DRI80_11335 [Chloroflexota bacterium]|nr:MAG: hypothetical protein DRI80_11335 [Chloroflexota bacterium]
MGDAVGVAVGAGVWVEVGVTVGAGGLVGTEVEVGSSPSPPNSPQGLQARVTRSSKMKMGVSLRFIEISPYGRTNCQFVPLSTGQWTWPGGKAIRTGKPSPVERRTA